jgi:hypothetical protein
MRIIRIVTAARKPAEVAEKVRQEIARRHAELLREMERGKLTDDQKMLLENLQFPRGNSETARRKRAEIIQERVSLIRSSPVLNHEEKLLLLHLDALLTQKKRVEIQRKQSGEDEISGVKEPIIVEEPRPHQFSDERPRLARRLSKRRERGAKPDRFSQRVLEEE